VHAVSLGETRAAAQGMLASLKAFRMDDVRHIRHAENKQLQLQVARELGLDIPRTLTTNDPAAVRAFAEILHDNPDLPVERRAAFLQIIEKENDRLSRLIHDLLDLAKLEADDPGLQRRPFDLGVAVADAVESLRQLSASRGVAIEDRRSGEPLPALGDRDRMIQVALNLLSNAIKFCPPSGGRVMIEAHRIGDRIELSVSDNGPGVPVEHREQARLFEPFRQVRGAASAQGTGLGLPIARELAVALGGGIELQSRIGAGSRFRLVLPVTPAL